MWMRDTLAMRLMGAITTAILIGALFNFAFATLGAHWWSAPFEESGLLPVAAEIVHIVEGAPYADRAALASTASTAAFRIDWYPRQPLSAEAIRKIPPGAGVTRRGQLASLPGLRRPILLFKADDVAAGDPGLKWGRRQLPDGYFMMVPLRQGDWLAFSVGHRTWGVPRLYHVALIIVLLLVSAILVAMLYAHVLGKPLKAFTRRVLEFGVDIRAAPIDERGPEEIRLAAVAVNAMQIRIQNHVEERTLMLATISHDLRTPLTRLRLRCELIEDPAASAALTAEIDELSAMLNGALSLFREEHDGGEPFTLIDLGALTQVVADDFETPQATIPVRIKAGALVSGRPLALKRALVNLVENAVHHAREVEIDVTVVGASVLVAVLDRGPGLPPEALETIFWPFRRLQGDDPEQPTRMGLGLTSVRRIVAMHSGSVQAANRTGGGLDVTLRLPQALRSHLGEA
jgi:signal transduction histidine kinase